MKSAGFMASTAKSASGSFFWCGPKRERIGALHLRWNSSRTLCFSTRGTEWANTSRSAWLRLRSLLVCSAPRIDVTRQPASLSGSSQVSARTGIQETQTTCFAAFWGRSTHCERILSFRHDLGDGVIIAAEVVRDEPRQCSGDREKKSVARVTILLRSWVARLRGQLFWTTGSTCGAAIRRPVASVTSTSHLEGIRHP